MTLKNKRAPLLCYFKLYASFLSHWWFKLELQSENAQSGSNSTIFRGVWPRNLMMTLKNNRAPLLCYFNLCASFHSHWWFQAGVTVRKFPIWVKFDDFHSRVTLKFDRWPWKTIGAPILCYFNLCASFHSHWWFQAWVTVRKCPIWVKFDDFYSRVTLKFDRWPWKTIGVPILCYFNLCASFHSHWWIQTGVTVRKRPIWVKFDEFHSRVTLKFDRWPWKTIGAPILCYFKFCASFYSHWWFQAWVTVRKCPIWVKFDDFYSRVTLKFDGWPWKTIRHLFYATSSFEQHFVAIGEFKLELLYGNAQSGSSSTIFSAVWPWNLKDDLEKL